MTETDRVVDSPRPRNVLVDERLLPRRFVVVSNRLPYRLTVTDEGVRFEQGVGGLVTALDPILRSSGGSWIGWSATHDERLPDTVTVRERVTTEREYALRPVALSPDEVERYYLGYANKGLWPLLHYFQEYCEFNPQHWETYREVNRRFADAIVRDHQDGDLIWIHDYHLMLVPAMVRRELPDAKIGFFLHIPFPASEIFQIEPHAAELLDDMLGADLVGFHIDSYARSFIEAVSTLTDHPYSRSRKRIGVGDRWVRVGSYPISIDFDFFHEIATQDDVIGRAAALRDSYRAEIIAVGVDRLDYSKGILERLRAIEAMLDRHPDVQGRFTFIQISAPSRTKVEAYREMRDEIERMVGRVNGRFGGRGCIPIDYRYESEPQAELVAYYRAADLALVTPLRDGMNLVAKEYVACRPDNDGALVLSQFTGARHELRDAVLVNPYDLETMADRFYDAITMSAEDKERRMRRMRDVVRRNDIYWWLERYLRDLL